MTVRGSPLARGSASSNASIARTRRAQVMARAWALLSRDGSSPSSTAASSPALRHSVALRFWSTSRSYRVLKRNSDLIGMFAVASSHGIGLVAGLLALPLALLGLRFQPGWRAATGTVRGAAVLMVMTAAVHL